MKPVDRVVISEVVKEVVKEVPVEIVVVKEVEKVLPCGVPAPSSISVNL